MPENIQVKVSDGDFYVKPKDDPKYMRRSTHPDKRIRWHCSQYDFVIVFEVDGIPLPNPFNDEMGARFPSTNNNEVEVDVKEHSEQTVYAYSVEPINPDSEQKKADPSQIIDP